MAWVATAVIGGALISGGIGYLASTSAAEKAAGAQTDAARQAMEAQRAQLAQAQQMLAPYMQAGQGALGQQQAFLGLAGPEAQQTAISGIEQSPMYQAMLQQGERGILSNAAATGGLHGGNVQAALAQFRPQLLASLINQQMGQLGGMAGMGMQGAMGAAGFGQQAAGNIMNQYGQMGAAQAGQAIAGGQALGALGQGVGNAMGQLGMYYGMTNALAPKGGGAAPNPATSGAAGVQNMNFQLGNPGLFP
mgnify:CR=1 FL=1